MIFWLLFRRPRPEWAFLSVRYFCNRRFPVVFELHKSPESEDIGACEFCHDEKDYQDFSNWNANDELL